MLRIYETSVAGGNVVSRGGAQSNPDDDTFDGVAGANEQKKLFLAPAQTTLAANISTTPAAGTSEVITLSHAIFDNSDYPVIVIGTEKMLITSGFGTTSVTVQRGWGGTTVATHTSGDTVYNCYEYQSASVDSVDSEDTDESGWVEYAVDNTGTPGTFAAGPFDQNDDAEMASINYNESVTFWRKVTVPADTGAQRKLDVSHQVDADAYEPTSL